MEKTINFAKFAKRQDGKDITLTNDKFIAYDAAAHHSDTNPYLSPFYFSMHFSIPVPGQEDVFSNSVEAVWQGLKLVEGKTDFSMFHTQPHKRPRTRDRKKDILYDYSKSVFMYGSNILDLVTARRVIYVPSYRYLFDNYIPDEFKERVKKQLISGKEVYFYDWDDNADITDTSESFAHASLLKDLINDYAYPNYSSFNITEIAKRNPFKFNLNVGDLKRNYSGRIESYITQLIRKFEQVKSESIVFDCFGGVRTFNLQSQYQITLKSLDNGNKTIEVEHSSQEKSETLSKIKKLNIFLEDILYRDFEKMEIPVTSESNLTAFAKKTKQDIERVIENCIKVRDKIDLFDDTCANILIYELSDRSYAVIIADEWNENKRFQIFLEKGTPSSERIKRVGFF